MKLKDGFKYNFETFYSKIFEKSPPDLLNKIKNITFGIAGCGGLGSNIALALVRSGVTNLTIIDFDKVELSNLNRQQYFLNDIGEFKVIALKELLLKINPFLKIKTYKIKLTYENMPEIFKNCKIVFEAFDNIESKSMIIKGFNNNAFKNSFLICANGVSGFGLKNKINIVKITNNIFSIGDFKTTPQMGLVASKVILSAMFQVNLAFDLLFDNVNYIK